MAAGCRFYSGKALPSGIHCNPGCPRCQGLVGRARHRRIAPRPGQRTSKAGKPFVTATIRVKDGDENQWWKVLAFSESIQPS
jgi:hypothetical protein